MELQGLQEALKVEVQCHQKLAVRSCPVGTAAKPLALIKPPSQSIAISVVQAKTPVSMVTAHINGQKALSSETLQTSPINLQTPAGQHISCSQMLGALTAIPIKVPQISSLQRLAGHSPSVLPQVRPKTLIPDSLPHSPCREQQSGQTLAVPQSMAVVSPKSQGASLPTANSTFSHERLSNGQEGCSSLPSSAPSTSTASASQGVAYAIISATSPVAHRVSGVTEAIKVQPLIFSPDSKVIIIQPQIPSNSKSSPASQTNSPVKEPSPDPSTPSKKEEDPEKIAFMVALGLVTTEHLEEIQSKRQERKRRSTANPAYSGLFEPEVCLPVIVSLNNVHFMAMFICKHLVSCFSAQKTCLQLPEQCDVSVGERRSGSMMLTVQCVNRKEIFSRATPVPAPITLTACIHFSKLPPGACGCAPSARRKF
uniref:PHD finger protein 21B n=2 Tax=Cyprinus carpio TaxID=7962 RepID=A0A8C1S191_CYPCA